MNFNMNIIFCSSLSSQLGANLALKSNGGENGFNIVIGINPEVNKYEQLITHVDFTGKHCIRIHLNNKILSVIVPAILVNLASIIPINIKYYLPRPHWLRLDCFERFRAKDTVYYGDGFAHLCLTSAPFWINHHNYKKRESNFTKNALFIYCYALSSTVIPKKGIQIGREDALAYLRDVQIKGIKKFPVEKINGKRVLIFPTTTFSSTGRMTEEDEFSLYHEAIIKILSSNEWIQEVLIKPHPGCSIKYIKKIKNRLSQILPICRLELSEYFFLSSLPLELLIPLLPNNRNFLAVTSTGAAFTASLYKDISLRKEVLFDQSQLKSRLNNSDLKSRMRQQFEMQILISK